MPLLDVLNHDSGKDYLKFEVTSTHLMVITNHDIAQDAEIYSNYDCDNNDQFLFQFGFYNTGNRTTKKEANEEVDRDGVAGSEAKQDVSAVPRAANSEASAEGGDQEVKDGDEKEEENQDEKGMDPPKAEKGDVSDEEGPSDSEGVTDLDVFTVKVGGQQYYLRSTRDIPEELLVDGGYGLQRHLASKQAQQSSALPSNNPHVVKYMKAQKLLLRGLLQKVQEHIEQVEEEEEEEDNKDNGEGENAVVKEEQAPEHTKPEGKAEKEEVKIEDGDNEAENDKKEVKKEIEEEGNEDEKQNTDKESKK